MDCRRQGMRFFHIRRIKALLTQFSLFWHFLCTARANCHVNGCFSCLAIIAKHIPNDCKGCQSYGYSGMDLNIDGSGSASNNLLQLETPRLFFSYFEKAGMRAYNQLNHYSGVRFHGQDISSNVPLNSSGVPSPLPKP